jgi:hypothetical protein
VRVRVVRGADDDGVDVLLLHQFAPVHVRLRLRKTLRAGREVFLVDVAQRHHVLAADCAKVRFAPAPRADQRDVQFVARRIRAEQLRVRQNQCARPDEARVFQELTSFHKCAVKNCSGRTDALTSPHHTGFPALKTRTKVSMFQPRQLLTPQPLESVDESQKNTEKLNSKMPARLNRPPPQPSTLNHEHP